jgi:hypothetical protein
MNSRESSNRVYKKGEEIVPIRYLNDTKFEIFKSFPDRESIHKSTFDKYLNSEKHIKKIQRKTDVCDFCEWLRAKSKVITNFCKSFGDFQQSEIFRPSDLISTYLTIILF